VNTSTLRANSSRRAGFTIVELLVATAVTALLAALVLTVVTNVLNLWERSTGRLTANSQARFVLDQLGADFEGMVFRQDGRRWFRADIWDSGTTPPPNCGWEESSPPSPRRSEVELDADQLADTRYGLAGAWIRFVTTSTSRGGSAAQSVAYRIVRRPVLPNGSEFGYHLYRIELSSEDTLKSGYDLSIADLREPSDEALIAPNVIDFGVRFWRSEGPGEPLRPLYPANASRTEFVNTVGAIVQPELFEIPEVAEVMVRVLTQEGVRQLRAFEQGFARNNTTLTDADYWWQLASQNSEVFVRRVAIKSR
jgi:prepilin-type N-terminal cleavage/methylation domain-containing protein